MKKFKSLVLAVIGLLCSISVSAHDFEVEGIYYNITSLTPMTVEVTYRGDDYGTYWDEYSGAVTIPESVTYNGNTYSVTSIGYTAFYYCEGLTSVEIPNSVISIGSSTFSRCSGLTSVEIPNSVTSIGSSAFSRCSGLTSVEIPNSVTSIGSSAFYDCSGLTSVVIPNSVTSIGASAFEGCSGLTSVVIPNSVTSIGGSAFNGTAWYEKQSDGVIYVGQVLYKNKGTMPSNTSIIVRDGTVSISPYAFYNCSGLTSVVIPNNVTSIGDYAFCYCSGLTSVVIPNSVTSIGNYVFYDCSGLTSVGIPNNVTSIGEFAFCYCSGLTSVEIPNNVTSIGEFAFCYCSGLTSVHIDDIAAWCNIEFGGITANPLYYAKNLYLNGEKVTELVIPNGVTSIGSGAFYACSGLTSVEIPNSVTSIGMSAFMDTPLRTIVSKSDSPATLDVESSKSFVFSNYTYIHAPLYVPEGAYWNYAYANGWGDFIHIKEMAMTEDALLSNKAYMIADSKGTNFKVYDAERDALKNVEYTHALDEESKDCCWTVMKENGKTYLYNLGAKKFGVVGDNGAISLSETPVHVAISETEGGLSINGNNCMFVLNKHVEVDATGISDVLLNGQDAKNAQIHSLDGRRQQTLKRGVNIVNGKKVFVQ